MNRHPPDINITAQPTITDEPALTTAFTPSETPETHATAVPVTSIPTTEITPPAMPTATPSADLIDLPPAPPLLGRLDMQDNLLPGPAITEEPSFTSPDTPLATTGNTFYTYLSPPAAGEAAMQATIAKANADPLNTYVILMAAGTYQFLIPLPPSTNIFDIRGKVVIRGMDDTFTNAAQVRFERLPGQPSYRFFNIRAEGSLTLYNVFMKGGGGVGSGGAIFNRGILNLYNTTFEANSATIQGGAIYTNDTGTTTMSQVVFRSNSAPRGGALANGGGVINVNYISGTYCLVFRGNSASTSAGAVYNPSGTTRVNRGIYRENSAPIYRDIENQLVSPLVNANNSWWQVSPSVSPNVTTNNSVIGGTVPNMDCTVPPPPAAIRAIDYGLVFNGNWTLEERVAVLNSAARIAEAFTLQVSSVVVPHVFFKRVMGVANGSVIDQGNITMIRVTQSQFFCNADNNNRTITCGNLQDSSGNPRQISEYVITHEFGHIFNNQSARNGNKALLAYVDDTRLVAPLLDVQQNIVMGTVFCSSISVWLRGERGWGTGPGSTYPVSTNICAPGVRLFTDFQQNPQPYQNQQTAIDETAADMFLNWVYRKSNRGGFLNRTWSPLDFSSSFIPPKSCNLVGGGCDDSIRAPGNARLGWMQTIMNTIFINRGW